MNRHMKNPGIRIKSIQTLIDIWFTIKQVNFDYRLDDGTWQNQNRDIHDHGNAAAILLYNSNKRTIVLIKQFRMATYLNQNEDGMLIEVPAGLLEDNDPETCIIKEVEEETGYRISKVEKVLETYMAPGCVTELVHLFIAKYTDDMKVSEGGGLDEEHENIEVLEMEFSEAVRMMEDGAIRDAKTIMLLQYALLHNLLE